MTYHYKDIYRILIPGVLLYFILQNREYCFRYMIESLSRNSNVVYMFVIPIVGFILGFANNFISSLLEKLYYHYASRPSFWLLKSKGPITLNNELLSKLLDMYKGTKITNDIAYKIYSVASQALSERSELIETNYNYMIFSRNIFIPMLLLLIAICGSLDCIELMIAFLFFLTVPFIWQWYSLQHTKYIFVEYGKGLNLQRTKSVS